MATTLTPDQMQQRLQAPQSSPKTLSVDEMNARLSSDAEKPTAAEGFARTVDDAMRSAARGITFGGADELAALLSSLTGIGGQPGAQGDYATNLEAERVRDEAIPLGVAIPGEIAGGLMTGVGAGRAIAGLLPRAVAAFPRVVGAPARFAQSLPRAIAVPATGGATGAAYGFGAGEGGLENRLESAALGGGLGLGAGAVAYPVMRGLEGSITGLRNVISGRANPAAAARRGLATALRRDSLTGARAQRRLARLGDDAVLADVSPNVRGYARGAATLPGPAKSRADLVLQNRAAGESARVQSQLARALPPENYFATQENLLRTLRENAAPAYREAYEAGAALSSPKLTNLLQRPIVQDAIEEARDLAAISGDELMPNPPTGISTEALDNVKRGFDRLLERNINRNSVTGGLNTRGRAILALRNEILDEADRLNPAYRAARAQYASDFNAVEALRQGRTFQRMAPEEITTFMQNADDASKDAFRSGAARSMLEMMESRADTATASNRLFNNAAMRQRLQAIFPDQETYRRMADVLRAEMRFGKTKNNLLSGSDTAVKLAEQTDQGIVNEAAVREGGFLGNLARGMYQRAVAPSENLATEIARLTINRNPEANRAALDAILPLMQRQARNQATREMFEEMIVRSLGQVIGTQSGRQYSAPYERPPEIRMANGD